MNSRLPASLHLSFTGFSRRGGATDHHADGWGIAYFESEGEKPGRGIRHFVDKQSAATSPLAGMLRSFPIKSHNIVAHVRKATVGPTTLENAHPFVRELWGRYWVFAHNGDLKDFNPRLHGHFRPVGDTDSELAFCWLLQEIQKSHAGVPGVAELSMTLQELVPQVARHGSFNFLLSNGQALWAHASTRLHYLVRQFPFTEVHLRDEDLKMDLAQHNGPQDRLAIVVTEPLTTNERWTALEPGQLLTFVEGATLAPCARRRIEPTQV